MPRFVIRADWPIGQIRNVCSACGLSLRDDFGGPGVRERVMEVGGVMIGDVERPGEYPLALCESCVVDMARNVGMIDAGQATQLAAENETLTTELAAARDAASAAHAAISALSAAGYAEPVVEPPANASAAETTVGTPEPAAETVEPAPKRKVKDAPQA